jgi:MFS family permease
VIGAFASSGAVGGILVGSATGAALAAAMSPETLDAWGWRIPFLIRLVVGLAGMVLRRGIREQRAPRRPSARRCWTRCATTARSCRGSPPSRSSTPCNQAAGATEGSWSWSMKQA